MIDILGPAQLAEKIGFASDASGSKEKWRLWLCTKYTVDAWKMGSNFPKRV